MAICFEECNCWDTLKKVNFLVKNCNSCREQHWKLKETSHLKHWWQKINRICKKNFLYVTNKPIKERRVVAPRLTSCEIHMRFIFKIKWQVSNKKLYGLWWGRNRNDWHNMKDLVREQMFMLLELIHLLLIWIHHQVMSHWKQQKRVTAKEIYS